jgi:hypothetical protein
MYGRLFAETPKSQVQTINKSNIAAKAPAILAICI